MVEVLEGKTTTEVVKILDPEGQQSFTRSLQTIQACGPDDLDALFRPRPVSIRKPGESINLQ